MITKNKKGTIKGANLKTQGNYNIDPLNLPSIKAVVAEELARHPKLRDDDFLLIHQIYNDYFMTNGKTFTDVMVHHYEYGLPSFETIRRCRQKLQQKYPAVYGSSQHTREKRKEQEAEYYAFGLEG